MEISKEWPDWTIKCPDEEAFVLACCVGVTVAILQGKSGVAAEQINLIQMRLRMSEDQMIKFLLAQCNQFGSVGAK